MNTNNKTTIKRPEIPGLVLMVISIFAVVYPVPPLLLKSIYMLMIPFTVLVILWGTSSNVEYSMGEVSHETVKGDEESCSVGEGSRVDGGSRNSKKRFAGTR